MKEIVHAWKPIWGSISWLAFMGLAALLAPLISNDKPLFCTCEGATYFPAFFPSKAVPLGANNGYLSSDQVDWAQQPCKRAIWPLVPFSSQPYDGKNEEFQPPLSRNKSGKLHLLGTTRARQDLLASLVYGTRISLTIGLLTALWAVGLGVGIGAMAGFFGDQRLQFSRGKTWGICLGLFCSWYYLFYLRFDAWDAAVARGPWQILAETGLRLGLSTALTGGLGWILNRLPGAFFQKQTRIPLDSLSQKLMEIIQSLPSLVLILTVGAVSGRNLWIMMLMLGAVSWVGVARLVRADIIRAQASAYMEASKALGYSLGRQLGFHALPNALNTAWVALAMGVGSAITAESSLAFLGLVEGPMSWGRLFGALDGQELVSYWWVGVFPSLCIFFTVLACNRISEFFRDRMDPRSRQPVS